MSSEEIAIKLLAAFVLMDMESELLGDGEETPYENYINLVIPMLDEFKKS